MADLLSYTIEDFNGGISDKPNKGVKGSFKFGYGINVRDDLSVLTCNQAMKKDSGSTVTDLINFFVPASDGNLYGFGDTGKIYQRTPGGAWSLIYTDAGGAILGAAEFEHNDGSGNYVPYLVWATQTKLRKAKLSNISGTVTDAGNFAKGISGDWHTMAPVQGVLEIADGDRLAMLDYEAAFNASALRLPTALKIQTLIEQGDQAVIGAIERAKSQKGWAFTWERTADSWGMKKGISGRGVNAIIFFESGMAVMSGNGTLKYWDLVNLIPLKNFPGGGTVQPGGVDEYKEVPHFGIYGGTKNGLYSYGRSDKNGVYSLNLDYLLSPVLAAGGAEFDLDAIEEKMADAALKIGAVSTYNGTPFVSWKDGDTYGVDTIDPDNKMPAVFESLEFNAGHPETDKMWRYIKAVANNIPEGTEVRFKYKTNQDTDWQETKRDDNVEILAPGEKAAVFSTEGQGEIYQVRVELIPAGNVAPEVQSINNYFEATGIF